MERNSRIVGTAALALALLFTAGPVLAFYADALLELPPDEPLPQALTAWGALGWTLLLAALVALGAAAVGIPAGAALAALRGKRRAAAGFLALAAFVIPPFVYADAWQNLANSLRHALAEPRYGETVPAFGGFATTVFILVLAFWPVTAFAVAAALSRLPRPVRESAELSLGRFARFRHIFLPFAFPFAAGAVVLAFLLAFANHTVPALYLVPVYGYTVYFDYQISLSSRLMVMETLPQIVLAAAGGAALYFVFRRRGAPVPCVAADAPKPWRPGVAVLTAILALGVLLPLGYLAYHAASWRELSAAFMESLPAMGWSLLLASVAATLAVALGFAGGYFAEIKRRRGWNMVTLLALFLFTAPGIVPGIGLKRMAAFLGRGAGLPLAAVGCALPFLAIALLAGRAAFRNADTAQFEAAAVVRLSTWQKLRHIILPMTKSEITAAWLLVFTLALGEVTVIGLFIPPGMETLSRSLFMAMHYGNPVAVSVQCIFLAALTLVPVALIFFTGRINAARRAR